MQCSVLQTKNIIHNPLEFAPSTKESLFFIQLLCYNIGRKYYLMSFLVSVIKIYRVQIDIAKSREKNYVIFDGPSHAFNILNTNEERSHFVTATFQCFLQFLLTFQFKWKKSDLFYYHHDNNSLHKIYIDSEVIIQIPFIHCQ